MTEIEVLFEAIKDTLGLKRDYQIAELIGVPQNTLYAWKNRNQNERLMQEIMKAVPEKVDEILSKTSESAQIITNSSIATVIDKRAGGNNTVNQTSSLSNNTEVDKKTMSIFLSIYHNASEKNMLDDLNKELWALGAKFV